MAKWPLVGRGGDGCGKKNDLEGKHRPLLGADRKKAKKEEERKKYFVALASLSGNFEGPQKEELKDRSSSRLPNRKETRGSFLVASYATL